jgi:hypothetical protein
MLMNHQLLPVNLHCRLQQEGEICYLILVIDPEEVCAYYHMLTKEHHCYAPSS